MPQSLEGKRALICGASSGIGLACAQEMARKGAAVTLVARTRDSLIEACQSLDRELGQEHTHIEADFTAPGEAQATVAAHQRETGHFHILMNNTGGPPSGMTINADSEDFRTAFDMHVICSQLLARTLVPGMKEAGYGRIINILSSTVIMPIRSLGISNTIRAAMANWARTLASELAPFGITVNNVLPGFIKTERLDELFVAKAERLGVTPGEVADNVLQRIPCHRLGRPEDVAGLTAFLAAPTSDYINGVSIPVDGGRVAAQSL